MIDKNGSFQIYTWCMHLLSLLSLNSPLYEHKKNVTRMCLNPHLNYGSSWRRETNFSPPVNIFTYLSKAVLLLWIICVI